VRDKAGNIADTWLYDFRHSHASHAILDGENLHMAERLLRYRRVATINRYTHLDGTALRDDTDRVAIVIVKKL